MEAGPSVVELFFNGRREILNVLDVGGDIVKYLTKLNPICPLIGAQIKLEEKLGKGSYGTVFLIDFPGKGTKQYAAKRNDVPMETIDFYPRQGSYRQRLINYKTEMVALGEILGEKDEFNINEDEFFKFNGINNPNEIPANKVTLYYPKFMVNACETKLTFERTDNDRDITVPKGSLICQNTITEIIISLLTGELYRDGTSINFIDVFYFGTCRPDTKKVQQYTFMERIDYSLEKLIKVQKLSKKEVIAIYLQTIHALAVLQHRFSIIHGDLHLDNIFIDKVKDNTEWNSVKLKSSDALELKISDKDSIYLPSVSAKYIVKLGDWGLSVVYSDKVIGDQMIFDSGYDQYDGHGPWLPNFYSAAYDVAYTTARFHILFGDILFIRNIAVWMIGGNKFTDIFIPETGYRPDIQGKALTTSLAHVSPIAILTNKELMGKYLTPPAKGSKILTIGEIK